MVSITTCVLGGCNINRKKPRHCILLTFDSYIYVINVVFIIGYMLNILMLHSWVVGIFVFL